MLPLYSIYQMIRGTYVTFDTSMRTILEIPFKKDDRARIDRRVKHWANRLTQAVNAKLTVVQEKPFEYIPGRSYIIMSNHSSHYDVPFAIEAFPDHSVRMLAKEELFNIPLWGTAMKKAEFIPINRKDRYAAKEGLKLAQGKLESGIMLWIAPEGTRSISGELMPFKMGGFKLAMDIGAIIVPIAVRDARKILAAKSNIFHKNGSASVHIGTPIDSKDFEDRKILAGSVREQIQELMGPMDKMLELHPDEQKSDEQKPDVDQA